MKSILFNTEMVRAILYGRKTQTRMVTYHQDENAMEHILKVQKNKPHQVIISKYKIGDILYVKETFCVISGDGIISSGLDLVRYKADCDEASEILTKFKCWKPSIHMPKEYARIFLKVTNVKVERLQDISDEDCLAEGIYEVDDNDCTGNYKVYTIGKPNIQYGIILSDKYNSAYEAFEILWDSVAKDGYKIKDNPYVFRNEFERVEKPTN